MFNLKTFVNKITERGRDSLPDSPSRPGSDDDLMSKQAAEGFLCPKCMKAFPSPEELQLHYQSSHDADDNSAHVGTSSSGAGFYGLHQEVGERYKLSRQNGNSISQERLTAEILGITDVAELQKSLLDALENKSQLQLEKESLEEHVGKLTRRLEEEHSNQSAMKDRLQIVEAQLAHRESIDDAAVLRQELVLVQRAMDEMTRERENERDQLERELLQLKSTCAQEKKEAEEANISVKFTELYQGNERSESELIKTKSELAELEANCKAQYSETEKLRNELKSCKTQLHESMKSGKVTSDNLTQVLNQVEILNSQIAEHLNQLNIRDNRITEASSTLNDLKNKCKSLEGELSKNMLSQKELEHRILERDDKINQLSQDLTELSALKAGEGAASTAIKQLTQENQTMSAAIKEHEKERERSSAIRYQLEEANNAIVEQEKGFTEKLAESSLKQEQLQGSLQEKLRLLQDVQHKLDEMQEAKLVVEGALSKLRDEYNSMENANFDLSKIVDQMSDKLSAHEIERKHEMNKYDDLQFELLALVETVQVKEGIIADLQNANQDQLREYLDIEQQLNAAKNEIINLKKKIEEQDTDMEAMTVKQTSLETLLFEREKAMAEMEFEKRNMKQLTEQTTAMHKQEIEELEYNFQKKLNDAESNFRLALETAANEQLDKERTEAQNQMAQIKAEGTAELAKKNTELINVQNALDEVAGEKLALDALLQASQSEHKSLLEKYYTSCNDLDAQRRTIDDLRRRSDDSQSALHELGRENQRLRMELEKLLGRKWTEDSDVANCHLCQKEFTLLIRRHHCRNCGQIFCHECSAKNAQVADNKKPVRVCDNCYNELASSSNPGPM